jgi:oligopeptide transport system ATP-binding protein
MSKVLDVQNLGVTFALHQSEVRAVNDLSFSLEAGETLAVVGESGSGKSQAFLSIMGLLAKNGHTSGKAMMGDIDLVGMRTSQLDHIRGKDIAMIFQDPMTSLNPSLKVKTQLSEVLVKHRGFDKNKATRAAVEMLERVGIPEPAKRANAYPHEMSGGMRQRVMIAMALICRPKLLIADEPTTALDVTVQSQITDLLREMSERTGTALLFITHDLGVVAETCTRVLTMYAGEVVEDAPVDAVLMAPRHPYTSGLLRSLPGLSPRRGRLPSIPGRVPSPAAMPAGCRFAARCAAAVDACQAAQPMVAVSGDHFARCCRSRDLSLPGAVVR